ncbi:hypothetical protein EQU24_20040 [Methylotuvimicrobium buryatense]|uniref:Uncharacterized protein n=1 Tax=Methylotuvimicrobium buryatense TaxID=95641 RepID=A0A4P9URX5_METBY|nr:hypothetical protein EQU24_20040 [Methylotuvimicrobium buryatense]
MQILQEQKSALPPTPVNRATEPPSKVVDVVSCSFLNDKMVTNQNRSSGRRPAISALCSAR